MRLFRRIFWGLFFIVAAVLIALSTFGIGIIASISLFSLICTIFLIATTIESIAHGNYTGIIFSLAFLAILYADPLGITILSPWTILTVAVLFSIGFSIMFGGPKYHHYNHHCNCNHVDCDTNHNQEYGNSTTTTTSTDDGIVNIRANMDGSVKYINTDNFKEANIDCSMAGLKVYFDKAKIQDDTATININASFSGLDLYIPREWNIVYDIDNIMSGVNEKNVELRENIVKTKTVKIAGTNKLSGIQIIYI